jgi:NDP-sugar pyrophosphorylase family protein
MKALILAAGRGTRLAPLTDDCPKPMLPIAGVPMVERILTAIAARTAIRKFVLVTGYRADVVRDHFGDGSRYGWQVSYVHQDTPRGVGDAVRCAESELRDVPFLMTYGDIMLDPANYAKFAKTNWPDTPNVVGLNWVDDPYRGAAVYLDDTQCVTRIEEKPAQGTATTHWNNAGLFLFDQMIFEYTSRLKPSARGEYELPEAITAMIADGTTVQGLPLNGAWRDVGTLDDYTAINAEYGASQS